MDASTRACNMVFRIVLQSMARIKSSLVPISKEEADLVMVLMVPQKLIQIQVCLLCLATTKSILGQITLETIHQTT